MPLDMLSWLAALLVMSVVVIKMLSGHSIGALRREVTLLERQRDQVREKLEQVRAQRAKSDENLEFYERRRLETEDEIAELQGQLENLEAAARKYLASLGYDDADIDEALRTGTLPEDAVAGESAIAAETLPADADAAPAAAATEPADEYHCPEAALDPSLPVAVVPPTGRDADRLFLPDAIVTELLSQGVNVIDRSSLTALVREGGEDLQSILESEQYFRLAKVTELKALIVVNSVMRGIGVGSATCRVVELPAGRILLSTSYEQPGRTDQSPDFEPLTRTAHTMAEAILGLIHS